MADEAATGKGRRFASDLQRIRKKQGVSIEKLQEETKIPSGLIEDFEENGLFDHPIFNKVYLRSFVRIYARVINISPAFTLKALEEALAGRYEGRLAREYLDASEAEEAERAAAEARAEEAASTAESTSQAREDNAETREAEPPQQQPSADEPPLQEEPPATPPAETATPPAEEKPAAEPKPKEPSKKEAAAAGASASGVGVSPSRASKKTSGRPARRSRRRRSSSSSSRRQVLYFGAALVIIALGGWLLFSLMSGETTSEAGEEEGTSPPVATAPAEAAQQQEDQPPAQESAGAAQPVEIGPTMDFTAVAAQGPVRELRVQVDDQVRRPYWIEEGGEMTFEAQNRISFEPPVEATSEQPLDMVALQLEGISYPTDQRDAQGRIVVTRETAQAFLDSAAAQQPAP